MTNGLNLFNQPGLLGNVGMNFSGLLDPRSQAMMGAAQVLTQAGAPSRVPISTGQALANAMAQGVSSYRTAQADQMKRQMALTNYQMQMAKMTQPTTDWKVVGDKLYKITNPAQLTVGPKGLGYNPAAGQASVTETVGTGKPPATGMIYDPIAKQWKMDPAFKEFAFEKARIEKPSTTIDMKQEGAEKGAFGTSIVKQYDSIRDAADSAETQRVQLQMARTLASQDNASVNALPSVLQQAAGNAASAMGFNVSGAGFKSVLGNISNGQSFEAVMENLVLSKMQAQKGPQTEGDTKRIKNSLARLGNTPEARDLLLRAADAMAQADVMKADFWRRWRSGRGKGSFEGANSAWRKFRSKVPIVGISPTQKQRPDGTWYKPIVFFAEFVDRNRHKTFDENAAEWQRVYAGTEGSR